MSERIPTIVYVLLAIVALDLVVLALIAGAAKLSRRQYWHIEIEEDSGPCTCPDCAPVFDWEAAEQQMKRKR